MARCYGGSSRLLQRLPQWYQAGDVRLDGSGNHVALVLQYCLSSCSTISSGNAGRDSCYRNVRRPADLHAEPALRLSSNRTGVGKSQLAIDLAVALRNNDGRRGEVVNADSMQVYRGLDIITNKATTEEMQGVPHHLMGFLDPGDDYRVDRFRKDAIQKVGLHARSHCSGS